MRQIANSGRKSLIYSGNETSESPETVVYGTIIESPKPKSPAPTSEKIIKF